jgi:uncharacterized iron-regulated membrane protein
VNYKVHCKVFRKVKRGQICWFSLHSWIGIFVLGLLAFQFFAGRMVGGWVDG